MARFQVQRSKDVKMTQRLSSPALVKGDAPNPEVKEPQKRRRLTTAWKLEILRRFDKITDPTEKGVFIRSESLYLSQIYQWKRALRMGHLVAGGIQKRGPVSKKNPAFDALEKENVRLKKELMQARQIIELQKKVAALFGETEEI